MSTTAFPSVIRGIVALGQAKITGARTVRGRDISDDPSDVVMVGVRDLELLGSADAAGSFQQSMQTFGGNRQEVGAVNGIVSTFNGDADQDAALAAAFAHLAELEAAVRDDPTLGLTAFEYVVAELQAGDVSEVQTDMGAIAALSFSINYEIRI